MLKKKNNKDRILQDAINLFSQSKDCSTDLFIASILSILLGCRIDPGGDESIERIADFTASVSRERRSQLKKIIEPERRSK